MLRVPQIKTEIEIQRGASAVAAAVDGETGNRDRRLLIRDTEAAVAAEAAEAEVATAVHPEAVGADVVEAPVVQSRLTGRATTDESTAATTEELPAWIVIVRRLRDKEAGLR